MGLSLPLAMLWGTRQEARPPNYYLFTISKIKLNQFVARLNCSVKHPFVFFCSLWQQRAAKRTAGLVLVCEKKLTAGLAWRLTLGGKWTTD